MDDTDDIDTGTSMLADPTNPDGGSFAPGIPFPVMRARK